MAEMETSTTNTEVLHLSKISVECSMQFGRVSLIHVKMFEQLGIVFASDGRHNEQLDVRLGKASAVTSS